MRSNDYRSQFKVIFDSDEWERGVLSLQSVVDDELASLWIREGVMRVSANTREDVQYMRQFAQEILAACDIAFVEDEDEDE